MGALLALAPFPLAAQPAPPPQRTAPAAASNPVPTPLPGVVHARPALWEVKDKDTTIYLFGTIHLLRPGITWLEGPRKAAFDAAQELVLEIAEDADPATQLRILQRALDPTGPTLTSKLPEAARARFTALLREHGGQAAMVDRMKPWLAAITLTALPLGKLGYDPTLGVEAQLRQAARAQGKTITGLETTEEQMGLFESLSEPLQIKLLVDTINEQDDIEQSLARMIDAWSAGNPDVLAEQLNKSMEDDPALVQHLLTERNERWADWIKARLKQPGTVFLAVGAGHLAGKGSVQEALRKRRIKSRLLPGD